MPAASTLLIRLVAAVAGLSPAVAEVAVADSLERGVPFLQTFSPRDYRGDPQVWCAATDARGLMYFGNDSQVLVYDGSRWSRIAVPGGGAVRALAVDRRDRLWVGAAGDFGYVEVAAPLPRFVSLLRQLPQPAGDHRNLLRAHVVADRVYFQSHSVVIRSQADRLSAWPLEAGGLWQSMVLGGQLVLQNPLHGWWRVGPDGPAKFEPPPITVPPTRFALPFSEGRTLIGTMRAGLFAFDGHAVDRLTPAVTPFLRTNFLYEGARLANGHYALATLRGGAVLLAPDLAFHSVIDQAAELPGRTVNNVFADALGGLWLCLDDGIARIDQTLASSWFRPPIPLGRLDHPALARFGGRLHLGAGQEVLRLEPASAAVGHARWETRVRLGAQIAALLDLGDVLLIASIDGCDAWRGGDVAEPVLARDGCRALLASAVHPGRYYVGHRRGIEVVRRDGKTWISDGNLAEDVADVLTLFEESDGTLWAGTRTHGAVRVTFVPGAPGVAAARVAIFSAGHGLPAGPGEARVGDDAGGLLVATELGLHRFDRAAQRFGPDLGYGPQFTDGSTFVRAFTRDAGGGLWLVPESRQDAGAAGDSAIVHVRPGEPARRLHLPDLDRIGAISGLRFERDGRSGVLWAIGAAGLLRIDLAALQPPALGATLIREATREDGSSLSFGGKPPVIEHARNSLRFRIAAPGLAGHSEVEYETELVGLFDGVRHVGTAAEREFTRLFEGAYTFRARARAVDGRWTTPVEAAFIVLPPWWRTPWACGFWAALATGGIAGIVKLRTRALRRRARQLEETVAERTLELQAYNRELARLHKLELDEKISARLAEERARLEVLRYQLNPHFLFNVLNSICTQVMQQPAAARAMAVRLADFCRYTLHRPGGERDATLGEELQLLQAYLDIEQARLGELLVVVFDVEPGIETARIPPFLLLPLVENAVKYGSATSRDRVHVRIAVRRETPAAEPGPLRARSPVLVIEVANSGTWAESALPGVSSTKIGLENVRQRLARTYPGRHQLTIEAAEGSVTVRIRIADFGWPPAGSKPARSAGRAAQPEPRSTRPTP